MGRPSELTEEQRADLRAKGFVSMEIWVPNWDTPEFQERMAREMDAIAEADAKDPAIDEWSQAVRRKLWDDIGPSDEATS